jgi:WhiB family transcriptional regulator, redox-sensing transcriptional regulator
VNTTRLGPADASAREHQQAISEKVPVISVPTTAAEASSASWQSRAACLDCDPDLFFPIAPSGPALRQIEQAKAVCARCPVRRECLQYALATRQVHGVWGGTSEEERQQLRRTLTMDGRHLARPHKIPPACAPSGDGAAGACS